MSDLKLTNEGDLEVVKISDSGVENNTTTISALYDLNTTENYIKDLIIKAIKTPKGYLTIPIRKKEDILFYDINYGSEIYKELSEGLTLNFLSRVKTHILEALKVANLLININQVQVAALNTSTIQLNITYFDNTPNTIIQLNL